MEALEPAENATSEVLHPVAGDSDDEHRGHERRAVEQLSCEHVPRERRGNRDDAQQADVDEQHRPQDARALLSALEPVGDRARGRLLERPEEDDDHDEERSPECRHLAVFARGQRARGENVERVREQARAGHGA